MDKRIKITTSKQFEILTDFMIEHPSIAKGFKFGEGKEEYYQTWENLIKLLNSSGPPMRNMSEWQKVWTDYKLKLKKKLAHNKKKLSATGGGLCSLAFLSSTEEQIINALSYDKIVPQNSGFGLGTDIEEQPKTVKIKEQPKTATATIQEKPEELHEQSSRSKRPRLELENFRKEMLEEQTNTLKKIENHLEKISHTLEKQQRLNKIKTDLEIEVLELKKTKLELQLSKMT